MTDTTAAPPAASDDSAATETGIRIIAQFVRDFSFESPHAPIPCAPAALRRPSTWASR
jgi:preprotein translocase subunit SecB